MIFRNSLIRSGIGSLLVAGAVVAAAAVLGGQAGPDAATRAVVDAFVAAVTGADADGYEAMAQRHFAPGLLARATAADRRARFERTRADFGTLQVTAIGATADGRVEIGVRGTSGLQGSFALTLDPGPPPTITRVGVEVGAAPRETAGPPTPIRPDMSGPAMTAALDAWIAPRVAADAFAGVVLIARDGVPVAERAYGLADRAAGRAVTTGTRFGLGSLDKLFTKVAVGQLLAAGRLALTDTIGAHLPDYPNPAARPATIDQLLNHQGGIADFFGPAFDAADKAQFRANADYYRFVAPQPVRHDPGVRRQYCNGCYIVLGAIVERVSGMPYEQYVARHVFTPAGMAGAGVAPSAAAPTAIGYTRRGGPADAAPRPNTGRHGAAGSAAGGGLATASDLLAFDNALRLGRLLDPARTGWMLETGPPAPGRARGGIGASGGAPGVNAALESDGVWTVVVLANLDPPAAIDTAQAIRRALGF